MDDKYYKQQIGVLRKELKFHESESGRIRGLITKYTDELNGVKKERRENSGPYIARKNVNARIKREVNSIYDILRREKSFVKTGELCDMLNSRIDNLDQVGTYNSTRFAAGFGRYIKADSRFKIIDERNDDNQKTKAYGLVE